jgi:hypothetical protein
MAYPDAPALIRSFGVTYRIIKMQADGLSNHDSLLQLPVRGNCFNWVVGHIIVGRNQALELLGAEPVWTEDQLSLYRTGSEPITADGQGLTLERLLEDLAQSQQRIAAALERSLPEELAAEAGFRGSAQPVGQALAGLHWHETYHTGQLELLRQLAGTDDALI